MKECELNLEAKKIYDEWILRKRQIEEEAKKNGTWSYVGLDSNNHLFKELNREIDQKLDMLLKSDK